MVAQFGARLSLGGQVAPLQGEIQMSALGGNLALILPHGRTLGICTYSTVAGPMTEASARSGARSGGGSGGGSGSGPVAGQGGGSGSSGGPNGAQGQQAVKMECTPAEGVGREAASLLSRAGVAVYRLLPALGPGAALPNLEGDGWRAHFSPGADGSGADGSGTDTLKGEYGEQDGMTMDVYFVEISHL